MFICSKLQFFSLLQSRRGLDQSLKVVSVSGHNMVPLSAVPKLMLFLPVLTISPTSGLCSTVVETWWQTQVLLAARASRAITNQTANVPGASLWVTHSAACLKVESLHTQSLVSGSFTICLLTRSQRETWSCSPFAFLTWRLTHSAAMTIWMFTMGTPTWCKNWVASVEHSAQALLFQRQTQWCWRWCLMQRHRVEALWPISAEPSPTLMVGGLFERVFYPFFFFFRNVFSWIQLNSCELSLKHTTYVQENGCLFSAAKYLLVVMEPIQNNLQFKTFIYILPYLKQAILEFSFINILTFA